MLQRLWRGKNCTSGSFTLSLLLSMKTLFCLCKKFVAQCNIGCAWSRTERCTVYIRCTLRHVYKHFCIQNSWYILHFYNFVIFCVLTRPKSFVKQDSIFEIEIFDPACCIKETKKPVYYYKICHSWLDLISQGSIFCYQNLIFAL